ncbi:ABC transporter permease, partial [Fulvivirga sp. RKSG066]|uniref:ABC transporter permease n=1 Tax=Fulvivirga aurantia TaxID=2529383 RepID=UPI0012BC4A11
ILLKGVTDRFKLSYFEDNIKEGRFIEFPEEGYAREVVISRSIADKLKIKLNEDIVVHFFMKPPRVRKLKVVGIYETNLSEYYDDKFIIGDMAMIQHLNGWADEIAGGMEVYIKDIDKIDAAEEKLDEILEYDLFVEKVKDKYIQVFDWLMLISRQVNIFLGIILFVVCVNMISIILILIMERTQMVGLLKSLGATHRQIRRIFTYSGMQLIAKGLLLGNSLGIGICALQYYFQIIPLNPRDYYMSYVPIGWDWAVIVALNVVTFVVVSMIILIPGTVVTRINPIKTIKFD